LEAKLLIDFPYFHSNLYQILAKSGLKENTMLRVLGDLANLISLEEESKTLDERILATIKDDKPGA